MATKLDKKLVADLLVRKRVLAVRDVVEKFVEDYNQERDASQIPVRLESLDRINTEFLAVQTEIEMTDKAEMFEEHIMTRTDFENRFCVLKGFLLSKQDNSQALLSSTMTGSFAHSHSSSSFHHRLPKIDLPKFSGDESRWISFRDSFLSMIHSNDDIPTVNKLQYLLQSLQGEAKKPFETVDVHADNYASTWDALLKRYDNKRFLKKELFRGLYDLPPMKRESAQELNTLVDDFQRHVKALGKLGEPVSQWDTPLIFILSKKLDAATIRAWEQETRQKDDVTYNELIEFLVQQVRMLKSVSSDLQQRPQAASAKVAGPIHKQSFTVKSIANAVTSQAKPNAPKCPACPQQHPLHQCPAFTKMSVHQRRELVNQRSLCWNCFRSNHQAQFCKCRFSCRTCKARHHTMLHDQAAPSQVSSTPAVTLQTTTQLPTPSTSASVGTTGSVHPPQVCLSVHAKHSTVLLETVALLIVDKHGKERPVRALLDSASMSNFITKKLANSLAIRRRTVDIEVAGIGESVKQIKRQISATIKSKTSAYSTTLEFLVMKTPTANLPTIAIDSSTWNLPNVPLADPHFNVPGMIDIIIGGECYHQIHTGKRISIGDDLPLAVETHFGWTVSGRVNISAAAPPACYMSTVDRSLESALEKFWELEAVDHGPNHSTEEQRCEEIYTSTTTRNHNGRYVVNLPRSEDPQVTLGDSRAIATRRFYSLERRLNRDPATKQAYHQFIEQYACLNHMQKINPVDDDKPHCYLPHHPVFKETSTTTKVRVVFDASCTTTSGFTLNDTLLVGPVVQQDLLSIVIRFRTRAVAIVADIEKMYRQIEVHPDDHPFQRIVWRASPSEPLDTYELRTVTYGTASAPYLATRTLQKLAQDEGSTYPAAVEAVTEDFYVDDLLSGADDVKSAILKRRQVSAMLASAGFPLKKWASNVPEALVDVPPEDLAIQTLHDLQDDQSVSTLGLVWDTKSDMLRFNVQLPLPAAILTKRNVISYIARIFDPLGLVGPSIATAKMFMQRLWKLKTDVNKPYEWDRPLPQKLQDEWKQFHATLHILSDLRIPRFVSLATPCRIELHFFCDASEVAYGACCYVRSESTDGINVQLLTSKSKVAPLASKHSIARLELCAAVLSAKLFCKVANAIPFQPNDVIFWSDSTVSLCWLNAEPNRWKPFVGNRVDAVQRKTEGYIWRHVPGVENPADELSRGLQPTDLLNQTRWWIGPPWLALSPDHWPHAELPFEESTSIIEETRKVALVALVSEGNPFADKLFAYTSYTKLRRVVAYCMKFIRLKTAVPKSAETLICTLTTADFTSADRALVRLAQSQLYSEELADLRRSTHKTVIKSSSLKWLKPHVSADGIIRVGGRLEYADVSEQAKHPMILSAKHPLAQMLADYYHKFLLHAGPQLMSSTLRQKYWIIGGRDLTRHTYHRCIKCFRNKPVLIQQSTADLPKSRVTPARPFSVSGVDYCGPVFLKSPVRNRGPTKAYIAIFVCFATKAVHIELVSDLSTPAFISALRRFVARRGRVAELHSDNGTAFKGAANVLHRIYEMLKTNEHDRTQIFNWCAEKEIVWKFIPPRAPHFGGLWEAAVKSAKHHLLREIGHTSISPEDMGTLLAEVEMCLNSRPLTPIPTEPTDLEALTPGHFLVGSNLQAVPEVDLRSTPDNRLDHWKLTEKLLQRIWARWYPEYLAQLQSRATKGCRLPVLIEVGRIVIIKDDNLPPAQWPLGRIKKLHPGKDGITRVVTLKTAVADDVVRPVARIAILPMPTDLDQPEPDPSLNAASPKTGRAVRN